MIKLFLITTLSILSLYGCIQVDKPLLPSSPGTTPTNPSTTDIRTLWPQNVLETGINISIANNFSDTAIEEIEIQADQWNHSHPDYTFLNLPAVLVAPVNSENLNDYDDGINGVYFSTEWFDDVESNALAITRMSGLRHNIGTSSEYVEILEVDIILNFKYFNFESDGFDFKSVVLHELGHFIGVDHSYNPDDVMFPYISTGQSKPTLTANDMVLVQNLYPTDKEYGQDLPANMFLQHEAPLPVTILRVHSL